MSFASAQLSKAKTYFSGAIEQYGNTVISEQFANRLLVTGLVVLAFGLGLSIGQAKSNVVATHRAAKLVTAANNNTDHTVPSTTKPEPKTVADYNVAPTLPRYLDIPSIGLHARVLSVGTSNDGAIATPTNVYDTAWYTGSAEPGQPGATLIDGHVSSWTTHGVFYELGSLKAGDVIRLERGDGTAFQYHVVETRHYKAEDIDMRAVLSPISQDRSGLNLITCSGNVIAGTNEFSERTVVFASLD